MTSNESITNEIPENEFHKMKKILVHECKCSKCGNEWTSSLKHAPKQCANRSCKTRNWFYTKKTIVHHGNKKVVTYE